MKSPISAPHVINLALVRAKRAGEQRMPRIHVASSVHRGLVVFEVHHEYAGIALRWLLPSDTARQIGRMLIARAEANPPANGLHDDD